MKDALNELRALRAVFVAEKRELETHYNRFPLNSLDQTNIMVRISIFEQGISHIDAALRQFDILAKELY